MQPTLFGSLNTGYSGLQVAQLSTQTVSTNIANSDTPGYSRQVTIVQNLPPLNTVPGEVGMGAQVKTILRVHDEFVYNRLRSATMNKEFTGFESDTLQEVAQYFPDLQNVGISDDLQKMFKAWQDFANTPADPNQSIAVVQQTQTLCADIQQAYANVQDLQMSLNDQMQPVVDEINALGTKIAGLTKQITEVEANGIVRANDLRDQRDDALLTLNGLVNVSVSAGTVTRATGSNGVYGDETANNYVIQIGGYPLVDGASFHPLVLKSDPYSTSMPFYSVYFEKQDYTLANITSDLKGGKLGAIIDLRGYDIDETGTPSKGEIQSYLDSLNTFAVGMMDNFNDIYAESAMPSTTSIPLDDPTGNATLSSLGLNVELGSFDYMIYNNKGEPVATRTIQINPDIDTLNTVVAKFNASIDDNINGNPNDDSNSLFEASFIPGQYAQFQIQPTAQAAGLGYTFAFLDSPTKPTNFAGALGLNQIFSGSDASNIKLNPVLAENPGTLHAYGPPVLGDNQTANKILELQYKDVTFYNRNGTTSSTTIQGYYNDLTTVINADASAAISSNTTITAVFNAVSDQMQSISKVSIDEELVNLMKYQSAYGANAKVISTIDQMINTLLGIKQ